MSVVCRQRLQKRTAQLLFQVKFVFWLLRVYNLRNHFVFFLDVPFYKKFFNNLH